MSAHITFVHHQIAGWTAGSGGKGSAVPRPDVDGCFLFGFYDYYYFFASVTGFSLNYTAPSWRGRERGVENGVENGAWNVAALGVSQVVDGGGKRH